MQLSLPVTVNTKVIVWKDGYLSWFWYCFCLHFVTTADRSTLLGFLFRANLQENYQFQKTRYFWDASNLIQQNQQLPPSKKTNNHFKKMTDLLFSLDFGFRAESTWWSSPRTNQGLYNWIPWSLQRIFEDNLESLGDEWRMISFQSWNMVESIEKSVPWRVEIYSSFFRWFLKTEFSITFDIIWWEFNEFGKEMKRVQYV